MSQAMHTLLPEPFAYVFAGHVVQVVRPSLAVMLPCGQLEQDVAFAPDFLPAGHAMQVAEPLAENLPARQSLHFV